MPTVGRLTINIDAGTAQALVDLQKLNRALGDTGNSADQLKSKLGGIGSHGVTGVQATSGALRVLEGNLNNNVRAAERFLANTLGLGSALQKIFPAVGMIAVGGVFFELAERAAKFYDALKKAQEMPQRIAAAFQAVNDATLTANDDLRVTDERLTSAIAKLEHKPHNALAESLAEAREAADKLSEALGKDNAQLLKLLQDQNQSKFDRFLNFESGKEGITQIVDEFKQFQIQLTQIDVSKFQQLRTASGDPAKTKISQDAAAQSAKLLDQEISKMQTAYDTAVRLQKVRDDITSGRTHNGPYDNTIPPKDQTNLIATTGSLLNNLLQQRERIDLTADVAAKQGTANRLRDQNRTAALSQPYNDLISELEAKIKAADDNAKASTSNDSFLKAMAKGAGDAEQAIARLNDHLKETHQSLSPGQKNDILLLEQVAATTEEVTDSTNKLNQALKSGLSEMLKRDERLQIEHRNRMTALEEETEAAVKLAAAEMQGPDAARHAQIDLQVSKIADPEEQAATRTRLEAEYRAEIAKTVKQIDKETDAIKLQMSLIGLNQNDKLQAERAATLTNIWNDGKPLEVRVADSNQANARFDLLDKETLTGAYSSAGAGVQRFYEDLNANTKTAAQNVHDLLGGAFNDLNTDLVKMVEGQKVSWAGFFRDLAGMVAREGLNSLEGNIAKTLLGGGLPGNSGSQQQGSAGGVGGIFSGGIGMIQHLFGHSDGGQPAGVGGSQDGSMSYPYYVVFADSAPGAVGGSDLTNLFGGDGSSDSGGGGFLQSVFSLLSFGGFKADGGDIGIGNAYMVGERGPEMFVPRSSGTIIPNNKLGGGGASYYIDARGTNPADTELRVRRALREVHGSAVANGVAAQKEVSRRLPKGRT